jgi:hypothetical protein
LILLGLLLRLLHDSGLVGLQGASSLLGYRRAVCCRCSGEAMLLLLLLLLLSLLYEDGTSREGGVER